MYDTLPCPFIRIYQNQGVCVDTLRDVPVDRYDLKSRQPHSQRER